MEIEEIGEKGEIGERGDIGERGERREIGEIGEGRLASVTLGELSLTSWAVTVSEGEESNSAMRSLLLLLTREGVEQVCQ